LLQDRGSVRSLRVDCLGMSLLAVLQDFIEDQAARAAYEGADKRAIWVACHAADRNTDPRAGANGDCRAFQ